LNSRYEKSLRDKFEISSHKESRFGLIHRTLAEKSQGVRLFCIPGFLENNIKWLEEMKEGGGKSNTDDTDYSPLRLQLGQILSFGQACFDSYYQTAEVKPFADEFRNDLFGNYLKSFFPTGSLFRWEFIDITARHHNGILHRHMDYKNDPRPGYGHCVVYSFTVDQFRICFIMTSRQSCGAASERLKPLMSSS
jgi:hypothetical protein